MPRGLKLRDLRFCCFVFVIRSENLWNEGGGGVNRCSAPDFITLDYLETVYIVSRDYIYPYRDLKMRIEHVIFYAGPD